MSQTEAILQSIETVLDGIAPVFRERVRYIGPDECPCIDFMPEEEPFESLGFGVDKRSLVVSVRVSVTGEPMSKLADPYRVEVHQAMMGLPNVANVSIDTVDFDAEDGDPPIGRVSTKYRIVFSSEKSVI